MTQTPSQDSLTTANFTPLALNGKQRTSRQLPASSRLMQPTFGNLSIKRKTQLIPLLMFFALAGVVSVGAITLVSSLRDQLINQARSQVAVAQTNYSLKFEEMEQGLERLSANPTVLRAAQTRARNQTIEPALQTQLNALLQQESRLGNLEYVTLVGQDSQIIGNARQNRTGERFDPSGLTSQVLIAPLTIRSTEVISRSELDKESSIFTSATEADALIRYVVMPIRSPDTGTPIGALVAGDVVDRLAVVKNTVDTFADYGYSAIYQLNEEEFSLVVSIEKQSPLEAQVAVPLNAPTLLREAISTRETVTERLRLGSRSYTMAASPLLNDAGDPVGVIVYGAPETALAAIVQQSLLVQGGASLAAVAVMVAIAALLRRAIAQPVERLQIATQKFSEGNYRVRAQSESTDEIGQLAQTFNVMADNIETNEQQLQQDKEQFRLLTEVTLALTSADTKPELIFEQTLPQARTLLQADRMVIYRFNSDWSGAITHETSVSGWTTALNQQFNDPCIPQYLIEAYHEGRVVFTNDVALASYHPDHKQLLDRLQVKASLIVPLLRQGSLFGLLIVHHCATPHLWQEKEINFVTQLAKQLGVVLDFSAIIEQQQLSEAEQRAAKEQLQKRALDLLKEVDPVSQGDLSIRAQVTADEIGTIADSYNATIESLRALVIQVQKTVEQVATTTNTNETSILSLSAEALRQTEELSTALRRVETMSQSIRAVADNAQQAEAAVQQAARTVAAGDQAMNRTVDGFIAIRQTVSETAQKVENLGESSQQVSAIATLVGKFAAQTHLLALKASIEAARAGEQGQGFAIIADEIRSLAAQSAEATADIEKLVNQIQGKTAEVATAMAVGTEQVAVGTSLVEATRQSLNQITAVSTQINQLVSAIAAAAAEQSQTSVEVSQTMVDVAAIAQDTSTSATDLSTSFKGLLALATELQTSVAKFKVK